MTTQVAKSWQKKLPRRPCPAALRVPGCLHLTCVLTCGCMCVGVFPPKKKYVGVVLFLYYYTVRVLTVPLYGETLQRG